MKVYMYKISIYKYIYIYILYYKICLINNYIRIKYY